MKGQIKKTAEFVNSLTSFFRTVSSLPVKFSPISSTYNPLLFLHKTENKLVIELFFQF